jgi:hypothetical protein
MASNRWWETGNAADYNRYAGGINAIEDAFRRGEISEAKRNALKEQQAEQQFGAKSFDIGEFEGLLSRLEGSKMRQQRQKSVEGRRDIFAGGMANMMSNF